MILPDGCFNISFTSGKLDNDSDCSLESLSGLGNPSLDVTAANDLSGWGGWVGSLFKKKKEKCQHLS
jgi:hypothetical protein